ncbi:MAG TPA: DUF4231 domain-containing protein [Sphingomicrobium sp.]
MGEIVPEARPDSEGAAAGPPPLPFVLRVGVTGHRLDTLSPESAASLPDRLRSALRLITDCAHVVHEREGHRFTSGEPRFEFVSPLADGADQIAAEAALELGYRLIAILPFAREEYRGDLIGAAAQERFDQYFAKAECRLELPGERTDEVDAYVMVGRATVAHCDVLIAVWDGLKPRGPGGTGDVVEMAIAAGTPVIHLPSDAAKSERLLWAAFDPVVDTQGPDPMTERAFDAAHLDQVFTALLVPPDEPQERKFLAEFETERPRKVRARIEYPLLLAAARVKKFDRRRFVEETLAAEIADEWRNFQTECVDRNDIRASFDLLERAYSWSDRLATQFAQTYRSGHVFNFVLGGFAVCMGLSGFMAPQHKLGLALFEFMITLAILLNTYFGTRNQWHRRWLDYRQLAERLRPMRSLKLLGIAAPDPPGTPTNPVPDRWIEWYALAAWRAIGCPSGRITPDCALRLAMAVADQEIAPQVGYHERNSHQMHLLDHRLDLLGMALFFATLIVSVATLIGLSFGEAFVNTLGNWFTLVSAGFPALGTAIFGIRYQGDFGGTANRSHNTSLKLKAIDEELRKEPSLLRAADLTEEAARVMLGDLDEWCLVHQRHELGV